MLGKVISIEGNIGAGKSTLLRNLKRRGFSTFQEDLDSWGELVDRFYKDPHKWCFELQKAIMYSSAEQYELMKKLCETHECVFVERSMDACMVFVNTALLNRYITNDEYSTLYDIYREISWQPDYRIYLEADVDTCIRRIKERGRPSEQEITRDYLLLIEDCYKSIHMDRRLDSERDVTEAVAAIAMQVHLSQKE